MPAHEFEADEALEEGVKIHWLRTIKDIDQTTFTVEVMRVENGRPVPTGNLKPWRPTPSSSPWGRIPTPTF
jgi:formate dehydrogenase (NADP+) beta subunit